MTFELIKRTGIFIALCLMQALVLNRIHLFDCATPLLYVYFAITIPSGQCSCGASCLALR